MPLNQEQREEKDDRIKNSKWHRLMIGAIAFVFVLFARWALMKVNSKMMEARSNFWPFMKWVLLVGVVGIIILIIIIALFNFWGKQSQWDEHQDADDE